MFLFLETKTEKSKRSNGKKKRNQIDPKYNEIPDVVKPENFNEIK